MATPLNKAILLPILALAFATPFLAPRIALGQDEYSALGVRAIVLNDGWLKMKDGFGAEFFITDASPTVRLLPEDIRQEKHLTEARRGKTVSLALFIFNPASQPTVDKEGNRIRMSDVAYDIAISRPDGSSYFDYKGAPGWSGRMPSSHLVHLTQSTVNITFETIDPDGNYTVTILVHDKIAKVTISLQHTIALEQ